MFYLDVFGHTGKSVLAKRWVLFQLHGRRRLFKSIAKKKRRRKRYGYCGRVQLCLFSMNLTESLIKKMYFCRGLRMKQPVFMLSFSSRFKGILHLGQKLLFEEEQLTMKKWNLMQVSSCYKVLHAFSVFVMYFCVIY